MEFWVILGSIVLLLLLYPFIRLWIKRLILLKKLKKLCQNCQVVLMPLHRFWFLSSRRSAACDFLLQSERDVYAIKLFSLMRRRSALLFNAERKYTVRRFVILFSKFSSAAFQFDSKPKKLPDYEFEAVKDPSAKGKVFRHILLLHPCGIDVKGANFLHNVEVMATQELFDEVKRKASK